MEKVVAACSIIESEDTISLDELAARVGISPYHFQRTFRDIIGISPKKYSEVKRMEKFKSEIKDGAEVTSAMYDAGFGL